MHCSILSPTHPKLVLTCEWPTQSMQHFTFNEHTLTVELAPPGTEDDMLFDDGELTGEAFDHTGLGRVWPASVVLCRWLAAHPADVEGRRVLELGAGTGLPSLLCAKLNAEHVVATDLTQAVVDRLGRALADAGAAGRHDALCLPWEDSKALLAAAGTIDTVLLADVVYPMKDQAPLLAALRGLLVAKPGITILLASTARDPKLHGHLEEHLRALPGVQLEELCHESERDPLYGLALVFLYRLRSSAV